MYLSNKFFHRLKWPLQTGIDGVTSCRRHVKASSGVGRNYISGIPSKISQCLSVFHFYYLVSDVIINSYLKG